MSYELMYTSVPKGLLPGSVGYCTVAITQGCPNVIREKLENLSSYRHVFSPFDAQAHHNPVWLQHVHIQIGGKPYSVLSSIVDAGLDYSNRTNKFAHHVAMPLGDCPMGNPAWALQQPRFLERKWEGEPRQLSVGRQPTPGGTTPAVAQAWKRKTGDAGWAGVLAEAFLKQPTVPQYVIFDLGDQLLPLFQEAIALLPKDKQWQVTFSTFYLGLSSDVQCLWRGVLRDSPEAQQAKARKQSIIDLAHAGTAPDTPWAIFARTGEPVKPAAAKAASPSSAPFKLAPPLEEAIEPLPLNDEDEVPTLRPAAKAKPKAKTRPTQSGGRPMSNITFDEKRLMYKKDAAEDNEEKPAGSKLPYFIAGGIFALLLVLGLVITLVVSLSNKPVQAQATKVKQAVAPVVEEKGKVEQPNAAGKNEGAKEEKDHWGWKENNPPPMRANDRKKMADQQQQQPLQQQPLNPAIVPVEPGKAGEKPPEKLQQEKPPLDLQKPPGKKGGVEPGKGSMNQTAEDVLPSIAEATTTTKPKDPLRPLTPFKKQPQITETALIPVKYHQLLPQPVREDASWPLAPQEEHCKSIRLLGKNVFNDSPFEHALQASTYLITHAPGSLQFRKKAVTGDPVDIAEVVTHHQRLILKQLGPDEVRPQDLEEIIKILHAFPLLCEKESGGHVLHCIYASNNRIDQPPGTMELAIVKHLDSLTTDNESMSMKSSYDVFRFINPRMLCFGSEAKSLIEIKLHPGEPDTFEQLNEMRKKVDTKKPYRRLVRVEPSFDYFSRPQELRFKAILHFEGDIPPVPSKPVNKDKDKEAEYEKALRSYNEKLTNLISETNKNSPHYIIFKDFKVIAHFELGKKKLLFQLWQNTP